MATQRRNIKARYHTRYLGKQPVTFTKCEMVKEKGSETPSLRMEEVTEDRECWMISFPQGHSIRLTDRKELERLGFHLKPRMVDMETGDVVDLGGDPYDFANNNDDVIVMEDEELTSGNRRRSASST